jgi:hypothetical protein
MDESGSLSWPEFTQFLIDNFDNSQGKGMADITENIQSNDIINKVHNHQDKHFVISKTRTDNMTHSNCIKKVQADQRRRIHVL